MKYLLLLMFGSNGNTKVMKTMKFLLFLVGIILLNPILLYAENANVEGIQYKLSGNTAIVTGAQVIPDDGVLIFPSEISNYGAYYTVTGIADEAFINNSKITSLIFPGTIKEIGMSAFYSNSSLRNVTLNEGLETIKAFAFGNNSLESITIPASVKYMNGAFSPRLANSPKYLKKLIISKDNHNFKVIDDIVFSADSTSLVFYPMSKSLTCYEVPTFVEKIEIGSLSGACIDTLLINPNIKSVDSPFFARISKFVVLPNQINANGLASFIGGEHQNYIGCVIALNNTFKRDDLDSPILSNPFGFNKNILFPPGMKDVYQQSLGGRFGNQLYDYVISAVSNSLWITFSDIYDNIIEIYKVEYNGRLFDRIGENKFSLTGGLTAGREFEVKVYIKVPGTSYSYPVPTKIKAPSILSVEDIEVDNDLPAEYFNLQGLKVAEPCDGEIVIVRRGSKVTKEIFKK